MIPVGPFHGICDPTRVQTGHQSRAGNVTIPWMRAGIQSREQQIPKRREGEPKSFEVATEALALNPTPAILVKIRREIKGPACALKSSVCTTTAPSDLILFCPSNTPRK